MRPSRLAYLAILGLLAACSSDDSDGNSQGTDAGNDAGADVGGDAVTDGSTDATDAPQDANADVLVPVDAKPDKADGGMPTGAYTVVADLPLSTAAGPLSLSRLDSAVGSDGKVYFVGFDGSSRVQVCSFDDADPSTADGGKVGLQASCSGFDTGYLYFYPRLALDDQNRPAVVWDRTSNVEGWARYLDVSDLLFSATETTVNHPDIAYFDGGFTAVCQWYWSIGRKRFDSLPAPSGDPEADWDAGQGGQEPKGPSVAAAENAQEGRIAWVAYHGQNVFLKTRLRSSVDVVDLEHEAATVDEQGTALPGYPGWPHVAVGSNLDVHVAFTSWYDSGGPNGEFRGIEYWHLAHPGLESTTLFFDAPLGNTEWLSPSVAVHDSGDALVAFSSNPASNGSVLYVVREAGADTFVGPAETLAQGKSGSPYHPTASAVSDGFWVLYNGQDGERVHAAFVARR